MLASTSQSTSTILVILVVTPHALKMLSQAQVVIRTAEARHAHDGNSC